MLFHGLLGNCFRVWVSTALKTMGWLCWSWLWRDLVSIKYISYFLWISNNYTTHKKQRSGEHFDMKSWLCFFFHSQIFPYILKVFQSTTGLLRIAVSCKKNRFVNVRFIFIYRLFFVGIVSFFFCLVSFSFVSDVSLFVSIRFCLLRFVSFLFRFSFYNHPTWSKDRMFNVCGRYACSKPK